MQILMWLYFEGFDEFRLDCAPLTIKKVQKSTILSLLCIHHIILKVRAYRNSILGQNAVFHAWLHGYC